MIVFISCIFSLIIQSIIVRTIKTNYSSQFRAGRCKTCFKDGREVVQKSTLSILRIVSPGLTVAAFEEPVTTHTKTSSFSVTKPSVPYPFPKAL